MDFAIPLKLYYIWVLSQELCNIKRNISVFEICQIKMALVFFKLVLLLLTQFCKFCHAFFIISILLISVII